MAQEKAKGRPGAPLFELPVRCELLLVGPLVIRDLEVPKGELARGIAAGVHRDRRAGRDRQRDGLADEVLRPVVCPRDGERDAARAVRTLQLDVLTAGLVLVALVVVTGLPRGCGVGARRSVEDARRRTNRERCGQAGEEE